MGKNTVVIIDDDPGTLDIMKVMLASTKLEVICFEEPEKALAELSICRPKLVILDYNMPNLSGQSLMIKISEALVFGEATFVLLSSEEFDEQRKMMLATCGLTEVLKKPLSKNKLFEVIETVFSKEELF